MRRLIRGLIVTAWIALAATWGRPEGGLLAAALKSETQYLESQLFWFGGPPPDGYREGGTSLVEGLTTSGGTIVGFCSEAFEACSVYRMDLEYGPEYVGG